MALELSAETFEQQVLNASQPVLVDFWATWCGPCRMIAPIIEQLHTEYEGRAVISKLDVDTNGEIAANYGVMNIPTILIFKNGEVVDKHVGMASKDELKKKLDALL